MMEKKDMDASLVRPIRLSEQVAERLNDEIRKGAFLPGEKLPSEAKLSQNFGVSRTVIREALARLKHDGLLDSRQGIGARIAPAGSKRVFRIDNLEDVNASKKRDFFELRAIIEGDAAYLAARRHDPAHLDRLKGCLEKMSEAIKTGKDGTEPDVEFHQVIAEAGKNPYLEELMRFLNDKLRNLIRKARDHTSRQPGLADIVQQEHHAIFRAISKKDPPGAREAVLSHLTNASKRLGINILSLH